MYEIFEELLKENNMRTSEVAKATGISPTFFSEWKKGKSKNPNPKTLQKIATFFNVSVDYLMTGKEPQMDYLYSDENAEFLIEVTKKSRNKDFVERMMKYMSLLNEDKKSVDDMIDFMYNKAQKKGD